MHQPVKAKELRLNAELLQLLRIRWEADRAVPQVVENAGKEAAVPAHVQPTTAAACTFAPAF